jgi:hypothetical protein
METDTKYPPLSNKINNNILKKLNFNNKFLIGRQHISNLKIKFKKINEIIREEY